MMPCHAHFLPAPSLFSPWWHDPMRARKSQPPVSSQSWALIKEALRQPLPAIWRTMASRILSLSPPVSGGTSVFAARALAKSLVHLLQ
jgi:hypothetical protein